MSNLDFNDLLNSIKSGDFDEVPVLPEEFVYGENFLDMTEGGTRDLRLSDYQMTILRASTQIFRRDTLFDIYPPDVAERRWKDTKQEVLMALGKGSGKDLMATIVCAYMVYQLLCLKDPSRYYGKPAGNTIDIINVAINAQQANNVFFKNFVQIIRNSPWFRGRYDAKASQVDFDKEIRVYSGHSEREAFEGYNVIMVVLDEIDGFADPGPNAAESSKSADALYEMYKNSLISRFPDAGKLLMLSFPRTKHGFIMRKYNEFVADKEVVHRSETVKLDPDRPDGEEDNELVIEWEEDHIAMYTQPGLFALRRPSWEVNPTKKIEHYASAFISNYPVAQGKFACMPPEQLEGLFRDRDKVEKAFSGPNGVDNDTGIFYDWFKPEEGTRYYVHVDLAKKHDRCVVSMAHVAGFERHSIAGTLTDAKAKVVVDAIRYWTPTKEKNVDFNEVRDYIVSLRQRGFNIRLVTFDQWNSGDMMQYLNNIGIKAGKLGVNINEYTDLIAAVQEERVLGPEIPLLHKELLELRLLPSGKVDHPRSGSNDLADATAGAVSNAVKHTPRTEFSEMSVITANDMLKSRPVEDLGEEPSGVIRAPSGIKMPDSIQSWVDGMRML